MPAHNDLIGQQFGNLTVLCRKGSDKSQKALWECRCVCGNITKSTTGNLRAGKSTSCGCSRLCPKNMLDLSGQVFGKTKALRTVGRTKAQKVLWQCLCQCGNTHVCVGSDLVTGNTQSCGCYRKARSSERFTTHGMRNTKVYRAWQAMKKRCSSDTGHAAHRYKGRNIKVCKEWKSFEAFYADMGDPPSAAHSLDRIDNDGDYCPENCRWATQKEQAINRGTTVALTYDGKTQTLAEWAEALALPYCTIYQRHYHGWSPEEIIEHPYGKRRKKAAECP